MGVEGLGPKDENDGKWPVCYSSACEEDEGDYGRQGKASPRALEVTWSCH